MMFALAALVSGWSCPELKLGTALKASVPLEAVCLVSTALPTGHVIKVEADVGSPGKRLCVRVQALTQPNLVAEQDACGEDGTVSVNLIQPSTPHTYVIMPRTPEGIPSGIRISAQEQLAAAAEITPPVPPHFPPPPSSPFPYGPDDDCKKEEEDTLNTCEPDRERLCRYVIGSRSVLTCLEQHKGELDAACEDTMRHLDECLLTPHLLVPMYIASMLLLATASFVLLCTLLRCCCRYICVVPIHQMDDASTVHDEELSDEDDSVGSVTPLPSGVKMMETPQLDPAHEEDELPAYTEVVQGASIARSMPYSEGSPARGRAATPPRRDGSPKDNYRPDVQLQ